MPSQRRWRMRPRRCCKARHRTARSDAPFGFFRAQHSPLEAQALLRSEAGQREEMTGHAGAFFSRPKERSAFVSIVGGLKDLAPILEEGNAHGFRSCHSQLGACP